MGFEENIAAIKLSGHVKVELFDELTRKKILNSEGHNIFTSYGLSRFRRMSSLLIGGQFGANQWFNESASDSPYSYAEADNMNINQTNYGFMRYLLLTDNEAPITADAVLIPGNITGIGERYTNSSSALYGVLNDAETSLLPGKLKAVFDFATDRANGTHKSVFWATQPGNDYYDPGYPLIPLSETVPFPKGSFYCFAESGGYLYAINGSDSKIYKLDLNNYATIDTYPFPTSWSSVTAFAVEGNTAVYVISETCYVINLSTKAVTSFSESTMRNCRGFALLGGYLYYTYWETLYKLDLNTKAKQSITTTAGDNSFGCLRLGSNLVIRRPSDYVVGTINFETNTFSPLGAYNFSAGNYSRGGSETLGYLLQAVFTGSYYSSNIIGRGCPKKIDLTRPAKANLITGKLLDTPVTKNNTQTMKVTYTINIV